eukprot:TRINITY_DN14487_c0_g1_i1.p1 TRINITY_DN14487_c0_g1~~TRINITY_DN14487_c0_g1_i1.p1  ORF type:complete len:322 (+),score=16.47 TRINITY_DN14487_c0_g1_i1:263-1228(+)
MYAPAPANDTAPCPSCHLRPVLAPMYPLCIVCWAAAAAAAAEPNQASSGPGRLCSTCRIHTTLTPGPCYQCLQQKPHPAPPVQPPAAPGQPLCERCQRPAYPGKTLCTPCFKQYQRQRVQQFPSTCAQCRQPANSGYSLCQACFQQICSKCRQQPRVPGMELCSGCGYVAPPSLASDPTVKKCVKCHKQDANRGHDMCQDCYRQQHVSSAGTSTVCTQCRKEYAIPGKRTCRKCEPGATVVAAPQPCADCLVPDKLSREGVCDPCERKKCINCRTNRRERDTELLCRFCQKLLVDNYPCPHCTRRPRAAPGAASCTQCTGK